MEYERVVYIDKDDTDDDIINKMNNVISRMTKYGYSPIPKMAGYVIHWSNGSAKWYPYGMKSNPREGGYIYNEGLDTNQFFVTGKVPIRRLRSILEEELVDPLPLYSGSYEARERGIFSLEGHEIPPPIKAILDRDEPIDIQTRIALEDKFREN